MNLKDYDNKLVRIVDVDKNVFEGYCDYNNEEYNECIYGMNEEGLKISCFLFFKKDIKEISIIDKFTDSYSSLEKMVVEDGMDLIDEVLYLEEENHIYRLLICLEDNLDKIDYQEELIKELTNFAKYNKNKKTAKEINKILKIIKC